jgi:pimeloyl-ACP methyl ester carboxylesterase
VRPIFPFFLALAFAVSLHAGATTIPRAVTEDPKPDAHFPARMEVIHVPTGGVEVNGVVYVAAGAGPHPTFVLFHGLPGNERNLDVAQAVRRAGWNAVTINYRGSWGSPGKFSFAQNLEDARAALAFVRDPANAKRLNIDPVHIAIGGHSMGGWVAAQTLAADPGLLGAVIISPGDFGKVGQLAQTNRAAIVALMNDNRESLAGVTAESMTDELSAHGADWSFATLAPKLTKSRLNVLYSNDFVKDDSVALIKAIGQNGGKLLQSTLVPTDHSWSDRRIELQARVVNWLQSLPVK